MLSKKLICSLATILLSTSALADNINPIFQDNDNLKWNDMPNSAGKYAILAGNPKNKEFFIVRVKFPPNYVVNPHHHAGYEYDTVISGVCHLAMGNTVDKTKGKAVKAGEFVIIPPHVAHYGWTEDSGAVIQLSGIGPWGLIYEKK